MALQYTYVKERRRFGLPFNFFLRNEVLAHYPPVRKEGKNFITQWTIDRNTENRNQFAVASVNTENAEYVSNGMCHIEGGWPKDVDIEDEEQTLRYKKKLQRSEEYRIEMSRNLESMKKAVMQNAGVNVYEIYFDKFDSVKVLECYRHPTATSIIPASKISFSKEENASIAVAYSHSIYILEDENVVCPRIWDTTQNESTELYSESCCNTIEYHKKFTNVVAGGLQNGRVCIWDIRNTEEPQIITTATCHQGCVNSMQWSPKQNFEILSGSSNGEIFLWDIRKIEEPLCRFYIESIESDQSPPKVASANADDNASVDLDNIPADNTNACTVVEYDKLHSKYIRIGTSDGRVIFANKTKGEEFNTLEKIYDIKCHNASVSTVVQNWASFKCILTVDNCDIKIWCEDCKNEPIFKLSSIENEFSCGSWSRTKYSRFFIGKLDGSIDFWDLTYNHTEPYFSLKPACDCVKDVQSHNHGKLMACSYDSGDVYLLELTDKCAGVVKKIDLREMNFGHEEFYENADKTEEHVANMEERVDNAEEGDEKPE